MTRFAFRVNGNKDIGMGHLIRCLTLSKYLEGSSLFLINDHAKMSAKVREFGHDYSVISSVTGKDFEVMVDAMECYPDSIGRAQPCEKEECQEIQTLLQEKKIEVLITDLVAPSNQYLNTLKEIGILLVCIDELGQPKFPSDLVFNCNAVSGQKSYNTEKKTKIYMGQQYALLRSDFSRPDGITVNPTVRKVLVTCGATDMKGLSLKALEALKPFSEELEISLVVGIDFKFEAKLADVLKEMKKVRVLKDVKDMYSLMLSADMAIASGGTTMYELAALGIPSIILDQYMHQREFACELEKQGALINLGLGETLDVQTIRDAITQLLPFEKRKKISLAARRAIDGQGAMRVAKIIQEAAA